MAPKVATDAPADTTTNIDLEKRLRNVPGFIGVFSSDELREIRRYPVNGSLIVNLQPSTQHGSHWVAIFLAKTTTYYLDPFGMPPPTAMESFMRRRNKPIAYESNILQKLDSSQCGQYCVYFIEELAKGTPIYSVLYKLDQEPSTRNENIVRKYYAKGK